MTVAAEREVAATRMWARILVLAAAVVTGAGGLSFGVCATAQMAPPTGMATESPVIVFGIPGATLVGNTLGIAAVGLALLLVVLPAAADPARTVARRAAGRVGLVWALSAICILWLQAAEVSDDGLDVSLAGVLGYAVRITSGRALLVTLAIAIGYAVVGQWAGLLLASAGMIAVPLTGHASQGPDAVLGMTAIGLHVLGAAIWSGGLAAIFLLAARRTELLAIVLPRFSTVAGICIATVATSGIIVAILHLATTTGVTLGGLFGTGYGALVIGKTVCWLALTVTGSRLRYRLLPNVLRREHAPLAGWIGTELAVMSLAIGLGTALARAPM